MADEAKQLADTKRLMGALVRMKPKPHEEMKVGKKMQERSRDVPKNRAKKKPVKSSPSGERVE